MSQPRSPKPAKLVIGFFLHEKSLGTLIVNNLIERFGDVDIVSEWMPFDQTSYYEAEMGASLYRRMMAFEKLVHQSELAQVKLFTNEIENNMRTTASGLSMSTRAICSWNGLSWQPGKILPIGYILAKESTQT